MWLSLHKAFLIYIQKKSFASRHCVFFLRRVRKGRACCPSCYWGGGAGTGQEWPRIPRRALSIKALMKIRHNAKISLKRAAPGTANESRGKRGLAVHPCRGGKTKRRCNHTHFQQLINIPSCLCKFGLFSAPKMAVNSLHNYMIIMELMLKVLQNHISFLMCNTL